MCEREKENLIKSAVPLKKRNPKIKTQARCGDPPVKIMMMTKRNYWFVNFNAQS